MKAKVGLHVFNKVGFALEMLLVVVVLYMAIA